MNWKSKGGLFCAAALLIFMLAVIYFPARHYPFLLDDTFHFVSNPSVRTLDGFCTAWTTDYWEKAGNSGLYRPLLKTIWTFEIACLGGSKSVVTLVSLLLHVCNAWLLMMIALAAGVRRSFAVLAAFWFALHTASVEVLMTGVGQGELFTLLLSLLSLWLIFPRMDESGQKSLNLRIALFVLFTTMNLYIKEQAFMAAAIGLSTLWLNPIYSIRKRVSATLLVSAMIIVSLAIRHGVIGALAPQGIYQLAADLPLGQRVILVIETIGRYAALGLAPRHLYIEYSWLNQSFPLHPTNLPFWLGILVLVGLGVFLFYCFNARNRKAFIILLMTILPLFPFLNIRPIGTLLAERHLYHALAGLSVLIGMGATRLTIMSPTPARTRTVLACMMAVWALVLGQRTFFEVRTWKDGLTLWETVFARQPKSYFAASNIAYYKFAAGRLDEARLYAQKAIGLNPACPEAHMTLGEIDLFKNDTKSAREHFIAAGAHPGFVRQSTVALAIVDARSGNTEKARQTYEWFRQHDPSVSGLQMLGKALEEK